MCESTISFTCGECTALTGFTNNVEAPDGCLKLALDREELLRLIDIYKDYSSTTFSDVTESKSIGSVIGTFSSAEEIVSYARNIGAKKIGITSCSGFLKETREFILHLERHHLESYCVICNIGTPGKDAISLTRRVETDGDIYDANCNPALQAYLLDREKTELNVIIGLCAGNDSLFLRHSATPAAHLIINNPDSAVKPLSTQ